MIGKKKKIPEMFVKEVVVQVTKLWTIEGSNILICRDDSGIRISRTNANIYSLSAISLSQQETALVIEALTKAL